MKGQLVPYTRHPDGRRVITQKTPFGETGHFICEDCGTVYPEMKRWNDYENTFITRIWCNGRPITVCPFCTEEKK